MDAIKNIIEAKTKKVKLTCKTHGDYEAMQTYNNVTKSWVGGKCSLCQQLEKSKIIAKTVKLPKRFTRCSFDNYNIGDIQEQKRAYAICAKYANKYSERKAVGGCLILHGACGTGKTHLACAVANSVALQGYDVLYTKVYDVVGLIKATWNNNGMTEQQAINEYCKPDLLIIDEIGVQFGSETEELLLFRVLNKRYENEQTTIVISNLNNDGLGKYLGERLIDRFAENGGANVGFNWASHRKTQQ